MESVAVTRVKTYSGEIYDVPHTAYQAATKAIMSGIAFVEIAPGTMIATKNIKSVEQVELGGFEALKAKAILSGIKQLES